MVETRILALSAKHENAIPIFGSAHHAVKVTDNLPEFISYLECVIHGVLFYGWHETIARAMRRFCHLCLVDPALVEAYLGMTFEQIARRYVRENH